MDKNKIRKYLIYAQENDKFLEILTSNQKTIAVKIVEYKNELIKYKFHDTSPIGAIRLDNIMQVQFKAHEDEKEFLLKMLGIKYNTTNLNKIIENFQKYYLEVIGVLLEKEDKNSIGYINLNNKKTIYPKIFNNLFQDESNLLFYYFTKKKLNTRSKDYGMQKERLLIEQANLSQKEALDNALSERVSIIEGPPGTGKTTTIINILANLIYQNKKVLVVSKNNSAIQNVEEDLAKMSIPKCYVRMRKCYNYEKSA